MHRWVHDLEQLAEEVLLWVGARRVNHYTVQIVQLGIAQACLCKWRVGLESLSSVGLGSLPGRLSLGSCVADLDV